MRCACAAFAQCICNKNLFTHLFLYLVLYDTHVDASPLEPITRAEYQSSFPFDASFLWLAWLFFFSSQRLFEWELSNLHDDNFHYFIALDLTSQCHVLKMSNLQDWLFLGDFPKLEWDVSSIAVIIALHWALHFTPISMTFIACCRHSGSESRLKQISIFYLSGG